MSQYVVKEPPLSLPIILSLLRYWPGSITGKQAWR